ncbi:hypothetical protein DICVIV_06799 [Dictyocaulus viviparus]|uniref:Uncharacterized protein n=1 Tax=Dictyocaulus viviparus TaxID=29172 RepID=A0A0D8XR57_DICVI|nr:hypothetical protein DICVIV_06799 [Dictyocaulus viviparus]
MTVKMRVQSETHTRRTAHTRVVRHDDARSSTRLAVLHDEISKRKEKKLRNVEDQAYLLFRSRETDFLIEKKMMEITREIIVLVDGVNGARRSNDDADPSIFRIKKKLGQLRQQAKTYPNQNSLRKPHKITAKFLLYIVDNKMPFGGREIWLCGQGVLSPQIDTRATSMIRANPAQRQCPYQILPHIANEMELCVFVYKKASITQRPPSSNLNSKQTTK